MQPHQRCRRLSKHPDMGPRPPLCKGRPYSLHPSLDVSRSAGLKDSCTLVCVLLGGKSIPTSVGKHPFCFAFFLQHISDALPVRNSRFFLPKLQVSIPFPPNRNSSCCFDACFFENGLFLRLYQYCGHWHCSVGFLLLSLRLYFPLAKK